MKVKVQELRKTINKVLAEKNRKGTFFSITAMKRSDGTVRRFNSSFGYKKYLRGGEAAYDFVEKNLLVVWDQHAYRQYKKGEARAPIRCINCDEIMDLHCADGVYLIRDGELTEDYHRYSR